MKVTRIEIKDFNQFKNLDIDLTYPKGHAKEGQPLDKVCFIGQSGTGKTTLLKIIRNGCFFNYDIFFSRFKFNKIRITANIKDFKQYININQTSVNRKFEYPNEISREFFNRQNNKEDKTKYLINFPADLKFEFVKKNGIEWNNRISEKNIIDFNESNVSEVWDEIFEEIIRYRETQLKFNQELFELSQKGHDTGNFDDIDYAFERYREWQTLNIDPIINLADNCIDKLLYPFKLRVKRQFEFTKKEDLEFIKIEDLNGNEVPFDLWSTGTRQLLYSTLPLYLLKPENTIILFDEPERSLYPDMQRMIIDFYTSLTKDSQFFYATHSPIIASSFEPWEIVELKLDENGHVNQELYYEGEKEVKNYKWNPKYMRWDDILQRIFDLDTDGSLEREKKLNELATLNVKYRKATKNGSDSSIEIADISSRINQLQKELSKWN